MTGWPEAGAQEGGTRSRAAPFQSSEMSDLPRHVIGLFVLRLHKRRRHLVGRERAKADQPTSSPVKSRYKLGFLWIRILSLIFHVYSGYSTKV